MHFFTISGDTNSDAIQEIARRTNLVTSIILTVVGAVFLILVVYLVYLHITTKKPKRSVERYNGYKSATAKITDIEMVSYFVKPYERTPEKPEEVGKYIPKNMRNEAMIRHVIQEQKKRNELVEMKELRKSIGEPEGKKDEIEKVRFKVRYVFDIGGDKLYSGECFVYEKNENIEVGKPIEIKYNPDNPMVNFSAFSAPVGTQ